MSFARTAFAQLSSRSRIWASLEFSGVVMFFISKLLTSRLPFGAADHST
jgi:hypothetical protein